MMRKKKKLSDSFLVICQISKKRGEKVEKGYKNTFRAIQSKNPFSGIRMKAPSHKQRTNNSRMAVIKVAGYLREGDADGL